MKTLTIFLLFFLLGCRISSDKPLQPGNFVVQSTSEYTEFGGKPGKYTMYTVYCTIPQDNITYSTFVDLSGKYTTGDTLILIKKK